MIFGLIDLIGLIGEYKFVFFEVVCAGFAGLLLFLQVGKEKWLNQLT